MPVHAPDSGLLLLRLFGPLSCLCSWAFTSLRTSTIPPRLGQVIIDHSAPVFPGFRRRRVAALFVAADLVLRVETFEDEFAGGDGLRVVRAFEVEGDERRLDQSGDCFEQVHAFERRDSIGEAQVVSLIEPAHSVREVYADEVALEYLTGSPLDQIPRDAVRADLLALVFHFHLARHRRPRSLDVRGARQ